MVDEGAIKFTARHRSQSLNRRHVAELACRLIAWREILARTGLVGQDPVRYGGYGYGNVSGRTGPPSAPRGRRAFLISGTQTSGKPCMSLADFCVVEACNPARNRVESFGEILPSSESMTHAAIYDLGAHIRFVFHAHCPVIWQRAKELRIPTTDVGVAYGTTDMVREVGRLYRQTPLAEVRILAMGGHEDGIVVFGKNAEEAGEVMLRYLARGYEKACGVSDGLCSG